MTVVHMCPLPIFRSRTLLDQTKLSHAVRLCQPPHLAGAPQMLGRVGEKHVNPEHQGGHRAVRWPPAAPLARTHGATKQRRFLLQEGFPPRLMATHPFQTERSEEHTSALQSLMRISYAVFCLQKKNTPIHHYLTRSTYTIISELIRKPHTRQIT